MNTTAKELALGGMFTALGVVLLCLGGVVPLALYACPILASAVLLPVRERCRKQVAWSCYAAIALLGTLLGPDKEASMLFVFLGYYPLVKPKLDAHPQRALLPEHKAAAGRFGRGRGLSVSAVCPAPRCRHAGACRDGSRPPLGDVRAGPGAVFPVRPDPLPPDSSVPAQTAVTPTLTTRCMAGGRLGYGRFLFVFSVNFGWFCMPQQARYSISIFFTPCARMRLISSFL